ncbi:MAG TPA: DNA methyltransferase [Acetobacteraceae bacterium]|nr:DNA methyltransferase [Acetobacteraceae bacterium]
MQVETIGAATLYLGDCREIAPTLPRPAALISDPPYGQELKTNIMGRGGDRRGSIFRGERQPNRWPSKITGDDEPFDPLPWLSVAEIVLFWGAHKFAERLPPGQWLVWDKLHPAGLCQGDGEAAWLNVPRPMRIYRLLWNGLCVGTAAKAECTNGQKRVHPTQKPIALMTWCIEQARVPAGGTILDPYMGAGSTGIAAVRAGHPFTGIEIEQRCFDTACRRIEAECRAQATAAAA